MQMSLPNSLTDLWLNIKEKYRHENTTKRRVVKKPKRELCTSGSYELFSSIQVDSINGLGWTPLESPKTSNMNIPNLFTRDPNFPKDFDFDSLMAKNKNKHLKPQKAIEYNDSMINDCQSVQRNMKMRKRTYINSYLESQDGIYIPSPQISHGNYANSREY